MKFVILAISVLAQTQTAAGAAKRSLTVVEVLDRWEAGASLIQSYDLSLVFTGKRLLITENGQERLLAEQDGILTPPIPSRIYRKGVKRRGEFANDTQGKVLVPIFWDGKMGYLFQGSQGVVVQPFMIAFGNDEYEDYEASYRMFLGTHDRIALSKERKSKLLPREGTLYVVDVPATKSGDFFNAKWRVWLDPDRNFMPLKMTQWFVNNGHELHSSDSEYVLREVCPGVWAPVKSTIRVYSKNEKSFPGKCMYVGELRVIEDKSRFNVDVPDDLFDVKIPDGVNVIDKARNAVYIAGSENAEKYLAVLARDEKEKLKKLPPADRTPPAMVFIPDDDRPWFAKPLLMGVLAAVVVSTIFFVVRLRARRAA